MRRLKNKKLLAAAALLAVLITGAILLKNDGPIQTITDKITSKDSANPDDKTIRIIAAGDFLPHDSVNMQAKARNGYDYYPMMENMKPFFDRADIKFCVQAVPAAGERFGISGYPVFNAPKEFTRDMAKIGCNLINTGSNHTNDKGQGLINATLDEWDKQKNILATAGANRSQAEQNQLRTFEIKGVKIAFLSYVTYSNSRLPNSFGVNMWDENKVRSELKKASSQADFVIVSMRWGTEYSPEINAKQDQYSKILADNGADLVLGHGQHVQGPVKKLTKKGGGETLVWYGIGNFLNTQLPPEALFNGLPVVDIDTESKKVKSVGFLPFYVHYEWTADEKNREDLLARRNIKMYTFDEAKGPLEKSQNDTTLEDQLSRLKNVLNKFTVVKILSPDQY